MAHAVPPQDVIAHLGEVDHPADKDARLAAAEQARADARVAFTGHPADDDRGPGAG